VPHRYPGGLAAHRDCRCQRSRRCGDLIAAQARRCGLTNGGPEQIPAHNGQRLLIGGIALMFAGTAIGTNAPLTLAAFGISGSPPVFWNLPTAFLGASAAAAGIAFINSVGNISGYAAPQLVGVLHDASGSYRMPMLVMGAMRPTRAPPSSRRLGGPCR